MVVGSADPERGDRSSVADERAGKSFGRREGDDAREEAGDPDEE